MPLSLEQYADYLDTRDLPWPVAPSIEPAKAKPALKRLPQVRVVLYNLYGTLLAIPTGQLLFEHANDFIMSMALEKTIHEFKMWQSMSRKPGQPSEYMRELYQRALYDLRDLGNPGEKYPEVPSDKLWENLIKKLFQKDYSFDTHFYGALNEYSAKVAYFFHASLQGVTAYPGAAQTLAALDQAGIAQGLLADGQVFSRVQLKRALHDQADHLPLDDWLPETRCFLSFAPRARKPSETLFQYAVDMLERADIGPSEVLHVGTHLERDIAPARKLGMRSALFAGDKTSLHASPEQLKDTRFRPDVLITELVQLKEVVG